MAKPQRCLAWLHQGKARIEDGPLLDYHSLAELGSLLLDHNGLGYMPDQEFEHWALIALKQRTPWCDPMWADAAGRIVGLRFRGPRRKTRYLYRASVWNLDGVGDLLRLRGWLEDVGAGDHGTPGAVGLYSMILRWPAGAEKLRRPPWECWKLLYDHGVGGRTELLRPGDYTEVTKRDMNAAYPWALSKGVPAGFCCRLYHESDTQYVKWWYGHYRWTIPSDVKLADGLLCTRGDGRGARLLWPAQPGASGEGWYSGAEIATARDAGYVCQFVTGVGWTEISTAFAEWAQWCLTAKAAYQARGAELELAWTKQISVAAIGRFAMDCYDTSVWLEGDAPEAVVEKTGSRGFQGLMATLDRENVMVELVKTWGPRSRSDLLIQVALSVFAEVRMAMNAERARLKPKDVIMQVVDALYIQGRPHRPVGIGPGQFKQLKLLPGDDGLIRFPAAGHVITGDPDQTRRPGIPKSLTG